MNFNYYLGLTVSSWVLVLLVILAELIAPFKELLAVAAGHHWIAKAVLVIIAFFVFGFLFKDKKKLAGIAEDKLAWNSAVGSLAVIFLFYIIEFFV